MKKKYTVALTLEQRGALHRLVNAQKTPVAKATRARILLQADAGDHGPGWADEAVSQLLDVGLSTVWRTRRTFVNDGLTAALSRRCPPPRRDLRKLDGAQEAHLIALACTDPPAGHNRWTLRLLAQRFVELECGTPISHELVRRTLKKTNCSPT